MIIAPIQATFDTIDRPNKAWVDWAVDISKQAKYKGEFTTANRPTNNLLDGDWMMDTTLGHPIWYYSSGWIDATGSSV